MFLIVQNDPHCPAGLPATCTTFQLHNDSFSFPPSATLLARSAACPVQAFRFGRCAYGLQFHPEADGSIVSLWSQLPPRDPALVRQFDLGSARLRRRFPQHHPQLRLPCRQPRASLK